MMTTNIDNLLDERSDTYGTFEANAIISQALKLTFRQSPGWYRLAPDMQEAYDCIALKISRGLCGDPAHVDNWDDIAGFALLISRRLQGKQ